MSIHKVYAEMVEKEPELAASVDAAYDDIRQSLGLDGLRTCGDDRAERLIEAIAVYVKECGN